MLGEEILQIFSRDTHGATKAVDFKIAPLDGATDVLLGRVGFVSDIANG